MPRANKKVATTAKSKCVSLRKFAKEVGLSPEGARKAVISGRVSRNKDGTIDLEKGKRQLKANTDPAKQRNGDPPSSFLQARAIFEYYRAQREKLEYERESGKLIDVALVRDQAFTLYRIVRDRLMNIAPRLTGVLTGGLKVKQEWVFNLITAEVRDACSVLGDPHAPEDEKLTPLLMKRSDNDHPLK